MKALKLITSVFALSVLMLSACGGGGDDSSSGTSGATTSEASTTSQAPTSSSGGSSSGTSGSSQHQHSWQDTWTTDATNHWHACSGCDARKDEAAHTYGELIVDTPATCTTAGAGHRVCSVCSHQKEEVIPALGHEFSNKLTHNDTHHWYPCVHTGCTEKKDEAPHELDEMGLCQACGYYSGTEVDTDTEVLIGTTEIGTTYLMRFEAVAGTHYELNTNYNFADLSVAEVKGFNGTEYVNVPLEFDHPAVETADGYYYLKFIPNSALDNIYFKIITCDYEHGYIDDEFVGGAPMPLDVLFPGVDVDAGLRYFVCFNFNVGDKYCFNLVDGSDDPVADLTYYQVSGSGDNREFTQLIPDGDDYVMPTADGDMVIVRADAYASMTGGSVCILVRHAEANNYGFCPACGEYLGEEFAMHQEMDLYDVAANEAHYYRIHLEEPVKLLRDYGGAMQSADITVYRSLGSGNFEAVELSRTSYTKPGASADGYYYVVVKPEYDLPVASFVFEDDHTECVYNSVTDHFDLINVDEGGYCVHTQGFYTGFNATQFNHEYYMDVVGVSPTYEDAMDAFFSFTPTSGHRYYVELKPDLARNYYTFYTYAFNDGVLVPLSPIDYWDDNEHATVTPYDYYEAIKEFNGDGKVYVHMEGDEESSCELTAADYIKVMETVTVSFEVPYDAGEGNALYVFGDFTKNWHALEQFRLEYSGGNWVGSFDLPVGGEFKLCKAAWDNPGNPPYAHEEGGDPRVVTVAETITAWKNS